MGEVVNLASRLQGVAKPGEVVLSEEVYEKVKNMFPGIPPQAFDLKRDAPGDRERGMELLDQALAIFQRCAATKDVEKVLGKKGRLVA